MSMCHVHHPLLPVSRSVSMEFRPIASPRRAPAATAARCRFFSQLLRHQFGAERTWLDRRGSLSITACAKHSILPFQPLASKRQGITHTNPHHKRHKTVFLVVSYHRPAMARTQSKEKHVLSKASQTVTVSRSTVPGGRAQMDSEISCK